MEWRTEFTVKAVDVTEDQIDELMDVMPAGGTVAYTTGTLTATILASGSDVVAVLQDALATFKAKAAGIAGKEPAIIDARITEWTHFEKELEEPTFPELVGASEAAGILLLSRQRFHQIRLTHDFPEPLIEVAATPLWTRAGVEAFAARWNRKPGRPKAQPDLVLSREGTVGARPVKVTARRKTTAKKTRATAAKRRGS